MDVGSSSTKPNFFGCPGANRRFSTISIPKVTRSMSHGFDQRIEERDGVFDRDVEDVRLQELEHDDPRLLVASAGESSHESKPRLIVQFLLCHALDDVQQLLGDEAFEAPKGSFSNIARIVALCWVRISENQLAHFSEQCAGGSASFLFKASVRWTSASVANFPAGSLKNISILS